MLRKSFKVLAIQFAGLSIGFVANILLARWYGGNIYGIYSLISSWALFLAVIGLWGMDDSHLVHLPTLKLRHEPRNILDRLRWSLYVNFISVLIVLLLSYLLINYGHIPGLSEYAGFFNFGFGMAFLLTFYNNGICFLRGLDQVIIGEIIDKLVRPCIFLLLLSLFYYFYAKDSATGPLIANNGSLLMILILVYVSIGFILKRIRSKGVEEKQKLSLRANTRYVFLNVLYMLSTRIDILMLGLFVSVAEVGHYNVATKFADVFGYPIGIINLSIPTLLSKERHENSLAASPNLMYNISRNTFFQCLILGIFFLISGPLILGWYGKGFESAFPVLCILLISCLISASTGSIDVFFIMEGQEKKAIFCRIISLLSTFFLTLVFIHLWGMVGAALAMLTGNMIYSGLLEYLFHKQYGFFIHPFHRGKIP